MWVRAHRHAHTQTRTQSDEILQAFSIFVKDHHIIRPTLHPFFLQHTHTPRVSGSPSFFSLFSFRKHAFTERLCRTALCSVEIEETLRYCYLRKDRFLSFFSHFPCIKMYGISCLEFSFSMRKLGFPCEFFQAGFSSFSSLISLRKRSFTAR